MEHHTTEPPPLLRQEHRPASSLASFDASGNLVSETKVTLLSAASVESTAGKLLAKDEQNRVLLGTSKPS